MTIPASDGAAGPMTFDFIQKLDDEIKALDYELKNELPREIRKAREHGDLSENAEYHAAKERQGFVYARLQQLKKRRADLQLVDFSKIPHGVIGLGSTAVVYDITNDKEVEYQLVTTEDSDAANGKISTTSPIGRALLGKAEGDVAEVQTPGGTREMEVIRLTTIHDLKK